MTSRAWDETTYSSSLSSSSSGSSTSSSSSSASCFLLRVDMMCGWSKARVGGGETLDGRWWRGRAEKVGKSSERHSSKARGRPTDEVDGWPKLPPTSPQRHPEPHKPLTSASKQPGTRLLHRRRRQPGASGRMKPFVSSNSLEASSAMGNPLVTRRERSLDSVNPYLAIVKPLVMETKDTHFDSDSFQECHQMKT